MKQDRPHIGIWFGNLFYSDRETLQNGIVNHRSTPVDISSLRAKHVLAQVPSAPGWLAAYSAACLEICPAIS